MIVKEQPRNNRVLLFSGGLDSLLISWLIPHDILLRVKYGGHYEAREDRALQELNERGLLPKVRTLTEYLPFLRFHEREGDAIIPLRNHFFVSMAALYGDTITLGAMKYDAKLLDKSPEFFRRSSELLSYLYSPQSWCEGRTIKVEAPFENVTKTELVSAFLNDSRISLTPQRRRELLLTSFSCHTPASGGKPCGRCKPCLRKWIALESNGVSTDGYFAIDPWESEMAKGILNDTYTTSTMTAREILDCRDRVLWRRANPPRHR